MTYISHESLIESKKVDYYAALGKAQQTRKTENENILPRIIFFLNIIKEQAEQSLNLLNGEDISLYLSNKQLMVRDYINSNNQCSHKEIIESIGLGEGTVKQIINKLINMGKIIRIGEGRAIKYRLKK